jgi:hypothetical protein
MNMQAERNCQSCHETFVGGRADKKFCSVECRNNHFNHRHRDQNNAMRNVNNILRRNRLILERMQLEGHSMISGNMLRGAGFRFDYFTNIKHGQDGMSYRFCYEQGFLSKENDNYLLINQNQLENEIRMSNQEKDQYPGGGRVMKLRIA